MFFLIVDLVHLHCFLTHTLQDQNKATVSKHYQISIFTEIYIFYGKLNIFWRMENNQYLICRRYLDLEILFYRLKKRKMLLRNFLVFFIFCIFIQEILRTTKIIKIIYKQNVMFTLYTLQSNQARAKNQLIIIIYLYFYLYVLL